MAKTGRPSKYSEALATEILERLESGESLKSICDSKHIPNRSTINYWIRDDKEGFYIRYTRAKEIGIDQRLDELEDYARQAIDDPSLTNALRLFVDTRKWAISKLAPKKYGDKSQIELSGNKSKPLTVTIADIKSDVPD